MFLFSSAAARGLVAARGATPVAVPRCLPSGAPAAERGLEDCGFGLCGAQVYLPLSMWTLRRPRVEPTAPAPRAAF